MTSKVQTLKCFLTLTLILTVGLSATFVSATETSCSSSATALNRATGCAHNANTSDCLLEQLKQLAIVLQEVQPELVTAIDRLACFNKKASTLLEERDAGDLLEQKIPCALTRGYGLTLVNPGSSESPRFVDYIKEYRKAMALSARLEVLRSSSPTLPEGHETSCEHPDSEDCHIALTQRFALLCGYNVPVLR